MAEYVDDCPRCGAQRITFDALKETKVREGHFEVFCVCRACGDATIFQLTIRGPRDAEAIRHNGGSLSGYKVSALNPVVHSYGYVSVANNAGEAPPEHLPEPLNAVFIEGAKCLAIGCNNAAGTMFRLCVDLATQDKLPPLEEPGGPSPKERRDLGLRLPWLFKNKLLPDDLHDLASCIKDDGNDGAHRGTLTKTEAQDLVDFTRALLEGLYTMPARRRIAADRRDARRGAGA